MTIDPSLALQRVLEEGDPWHAWRASRLSGEAPREVPRPPAQDPGGGFIGAAGGTSPGATGEALCHLAILGLGASGSATVAGDWLEEARTPAGAWLDAPAEVPGELDDPAGARVWATASATCGLLAIRRDPGPRATMLLRGEADLSGGFTGGAYQTFAAAGAFWLASGPKSEMAEWALRWAREQEEEWWAGWERATALTFWGAAGIPAEHPSVDLFLDELQDEPEAAGWLDDLGLTLRALELMALFGI